MRLLVLTEKLDKNDESATYFHGQLLDMANECDTLTILVLENRSNALSSDARILSLGKERGVSRLGRLFNFYRYIFWYASSYDEVFVHRNSIYIVLGGVFWKLLGKRITFWYNHPYRDWQLSVATFFADRILTLSSTGFPLPSNKVRIIPPTEDLAAHLCSVPLEA